MHTFFNQLGMHLSKTVEQFKDNIFTVWNYEALNIDNLNSAIDKLSKEHISILGK